jgi:hypothetical protein
MDSATADPLHIELHLHDIRDLFVAPEGDPFDPCFTDVSGIEQAVNQLAPLRLMGASPRITVYLPPDDVTPSIETETRAALGRHLGRRIAWARNEVRATRRDGWRAFAYALVLSALVFALLAGAFLLGLPGWVQAIAYAVFIVVAWVAMWWAAETLLFDWLASRRQITILQAIQCAELRVQPEPPDRAEAARPISGRD